MGFWHTGYIEFHEPSGIDAEFRPAPTIYRCSHCGQQFDDANALRHHRFETHPFKRPLLFIRGIEVGSTPLSITRAISPSDIDTGACTTAIVNGRRMPVDRLAGTLAVIDQDIVRIVLEGEGATASFEIRIEIASDKDMAGVEHTFFDIARDGRLNMCAIEHFIKIAKGFKTALGYCDGICEYLYGVLAKERSPASSLPYQEYRQKFTRALDKLSTFDRPLANRISGLIEFHFNHFPEAASFSLGSRVSRAAAIFDDWLSGRSSRTWEPAHINEDMRLESLLTDWDTERLIQWTITEPSDLTEEKVQMEQMLRSDSAEFDQIKLRIMLAQIGLSSKNRTLVLTHASELRHSPSVARWAEVVIETSKGWSK